MRVYVSLCACVRECMPAYLPACLHICVCVCVRACVRAACAHACERACVRACDCVCYSAKCMHVFTHTHAYTHMPRLGGRVWTRPAATGEAWQTGTESEMGAAWISRPGAIVRFFQKFFCLFKRVHAL